MYFSGNGTGGESIYGGQFAGKFIFIYFQALSEFRVQY